MFASGIWQGVQQAQANLEKKRMDDSVLADQASERQYKQYLIDHQKATDTREQQANTAAGASIRQMGTPPPPQFNGAYTGDLGGMLPPQASVSAQPPQMFSQPPMPGQASVPAQPRQMGAPPQPQPRQMGAPPQPQQQGQAQPQPMPYRTVGNTQPPQAQAQSQPQPQGYTPQYQPQRQPTGAIEQFVASVKGLSDDQVGMAFAKVHPFLQMQMQNEAKESAQKLQIYTRLQQEAETDRKLTEQERHNRAMEGRKPASSGAEGGMGAIGGSGGTVSVDGKPVKVSDAQVVDFIAKVQEAGGQDPLKGRSKFAQSMEMGVLRNLVANGVDPTEYATNPSKAKTMVDFTSGQSSRQLVAANTAIAHLGDFQEAAKALNNGNIQLFNKYANAISAATGEAAPTNVDTIKSILAKELTKAYIPNGGTSKDRSEMEASFGKSLSNMQIDGAVETTQKLLGKQLQSLEQKYKVGTGRDDFDKFLTPEVKKTLGRGEKPQGGGKIKFLGFE